MGSDDPKEIDVLQFFDDPKRNFIWMYYFDNPKVQDYTSIVHGLVFIESKSNHYIVLTLTHSKAKLKFAQDLSSLLNFNINVNHCIAYSVLPILWLVANARLSPKRSNMQAILKQNADIQAGLGRRATLKFDTREKSRAKFRQSPESSWFLLDPIIIGYPCHSLTD